MILSRIFLFICFLYICFAFRSIDITFQSDGDSGLLTLPGNIYYPDNDAPSGGYPGAVLIHGSGPENRFESNTAQLMGVDLVPATPYQGDFCYNRFIGVQPFKNIAEHLADNGYAVMVYDKRSCTNLNIDKGCKTKICLIPGETNCLNTTTLTFQDFVTDAIHAVEYLASQTEVTVSPTEIAAIGHSQGCTIAPIVGASLPKNVNRVALLMGTGVPIGTTLIRQYNKFIQESYSIINSSICDLSVSYEKEIYNAFLNGLPGLISTVVEANEVYPKIPNDPSPPYTPVNLPGLGTGPLIFYQQWFAATTFESNKNYISQFLNNDPSNRILTINSPNDLQVAPYDYLSLVQILSELNQNNNTQSHFTNFITHFMNPSDLLDGHVVRDVLDTLTSFLTWN